MILVLRALGIGDLCTAVPALRALRTAHPDEELVLAAPGWLAPLVALTGTVDRQLPVGDLRPAPWPVPPPRLAVNLHGRGPQSHRLLGAARPGKLLAFTCPAAGYHDGPMWMEEEREADRWCRLLRWYGVPADPAGLGLPRSPVRAAALAGAVPVGVTVVHPGAKGAERRWSPDRFAAVAAALAAAGHDVVVTGSAAERPLVERVVRAAGLPEAARYPGRLDVGQLAALVAHARLVVGGDTGVGHLATAYGVPSVLVFGPAPPAVWGPPPGRTRHKVIWHGGELDTVSVAEVLAATEQVLTATEQVLAATETAAAVAEPAHAAGAR